MPVGEILPLELQNFTIFMRQWVKTQHFLLNRDRSPIHPFAYHIDYSSQTSICRTARVLRDLLTIIQQKECESRELSAKTYDRQSRRVHAKLSARIASLFHGRWRRIVWQSLCHAAAIQSRHGAKLGYTWLNQLGSCNQLPR